MRTLEQSLQDEDGGRLLIIAELWGMDLPRSSTRSLLDSVLHMLSDPQVCQEMYESLPDGELAALHYLQKHENRVSVPEMQRKFGEVRRMGPGRRDREQPWRHPVSALEMLWYRGWISTAFDHTPAGMQEFYFIPTDLLQVIPQNSSRNEMLPGAPAGSPPSVHPGSGFLLEDCTTLLADLRRHAGENAADYINSSNPDRFLIKPQSKRFILHLLKEKGILSSESLQPDPDELRRWFELPPGKQWFELIHAWRDSTKWNDLALVPSLAVHQDRWPNDPLLSRSAVLEFIHCIPEGTWWDLEAFLSGIREQNPAFQRPGGDFDSWYLQSHANGAFLKGFSSWNSVEGALIRTIIRGPLFWLGLVDLGVSTETRWVTSFRINERFQLLSGTGSDETHVDQPKPYYSSKGEIHFPLNSDPTLRYQVARAAEWEGFDGKDHCYYFTPQSLEASVRLGLQPGRLLTYLQSHDVTLPPYLQDALNKWGTRDAQASVQSVLLLQVTKPGILAKLLENRSTAKYLGRRLNPTSALIQRTDLKNLYSAALRLGILLDLPQEQQDRSS